MGRLTVPRYRALYRRFETHPPLVWMARAFLGLGETESGGGEGQDVDINDIDLPAGGLRMGGL